MRSRTDVVAPFSEELRAIVVSRGLTAHDLGRATGKHASVYSRWLGGKRAISLSTVDAVCVALDLGIVERN